MKHKKEISVNGFRHILYEHQPLPAEELRSRSESVLNEMDRRRSVREFSQKPVPRSVIENLIRTASTAPSGAHKQPWTFCAVSDPEIKKAIRTAAEKEERESYANRMSDTWLNDLKIFGTNPNKPFLEDAPWLIVIFKQVYGIDPDGTKIQHYYVNESVGIAAGFLISAIHRVGLVTLTHTPSPMKFLNRILDRPENEKPFLLLPVGYPKDPVYVPTLKRKPLEDIAEFYE